jgi:uncharacterized Zn finger protein
MTVPASLLVECPVCKKETLHEVLSGRIGGKSVSVLESTVRCRECGQTHHATLKSEKPVEVPVVISWLEESVREKVLLGADEVLTVKDEIMCGEIPTMVTSIESKGARVRSCRARDIDTIWAKRFDKIRVPFSINHQGRSYSQHIMAVPDEEFFIGDMIEIDKRPIVIHAIKVQERTLRRGSALARDIVRVYGNEVRKTVQRG